MRIEVDHDPNAAYVYLMEIKHGEASRQVFVPQDFAPGDVIVDFNDEGRLLGIEVLGARELLPKELLEQQRPTS